jgi:hypothetical protein
MRNSGIPFKAPKQEKATMKAKTEPPMGPKSALPKSIATVLLLPTVSYRSEVPIRKC